MLRQLLVVGAATESRLRARAPRGTRVLGGGQGCAKATAMSGASEHQQKNASPSMTPNTTTDRWTPSTSIDHWLPKICLRLDGLFSSLQTYQPTRHDPTSSAMKEVLKRSGRLHHQTKNLISKENAKQSFSKTLWWYTGVHGHTT